MIDYEFGFWGIGLVTRHAGTIFVRSLSIAAIPGLVSLGFGYFLVHFFQRGRPSTDGLTAMWGTYTFVLSFLLVFRTQIAYGRYWDGVTLLQNVRGVWFNAASNLIAFTTFDPKKEHAVAKFQHLLVRLMSLLYCTALQEVAVMEDENFDVLGDEGISDECLDHLSVSPDRLEVVMQWIQRLIVENADAGIVSVAPPILSRVFQELSNGIVNVHDAHKISEYPFPFPFAQMLTIMLIIFTSTTPFICGLVIHQPPLASFLSFAITGAMWSINYIAAEIEMPFGDDPNDLPIHEMQDTFNRKLTTLMHPLVQNPPDFAYEPSIHDILTPVPYTSERVPRNKIDTDFPTDSVTSVGFHNRTNRRASHWSAVNSKGWTKKRATVRASHVVRSTRLNASPIRISLNSSQGSEGELLKSRQVERGLQQTPEGALVLEPRSQALANIDEENICINKPRDPRNPCDHGFFSPPVELTDGQLLGISAPKGQGPISVISIPPIALPRKDGIRNYDVSCVSKSVEDDPAPPLLPRVQSFDPSVSVDGHRGYISRRFRPPSSNGHDAIEQLMPQTMTPHLMTEWRG